MSWLLENWFGSKENLEEVKEEVKQLIQKESYLGLSGIENPEQSSTRLDASDLFLTLHGPWGGRLEELDQELLQFIHDQLPPIVRDEVGVMPFYTQAVSEGYLVLTFIRNATEKNVILGKLPLVLKTEQGKVVARKTFDLLERAAAIGDHSSRPFDFFFAWEEFSDIPQEQQLFLSIDAKRLQETELSNRLMEEKNGLSVGEQAQYREKAAQTAGVIPGEVDLQVVDITPVEEGGMKVIVMFRNGLDKRLEFTEVPIVVTDREGDEVARVSYGMKNLLVNAHESRLFGFYIPVDSLKKENVDPTQCTAYIPEAEPEKPFDLGQPKGYLQ